MNLLNIILEQIIINENRQLADKIYFNTGILDQDDKNKILSITRGDNTTKIIADIYATYKQSAWNFNKVVKNLSIIHNDLVSYNPNVYPIKNFDILNQNNLDNLYDIIIDRHTIIENLRKLPSKAIRNMKADIRQPRDYGEMHDYADHMNYFIAQYSLLGNRDPQLLKKIHDKMFKSNITLDNLISFAEDKENLLGGKEFTKNMIRDMIETEGDEDMTVIFESDKVMVVKIESAEAIKKIGCNSFWCFTYGKDNYRMWNDYSYNGVVYVLIDFSMPVDSSEFMHTLIKPLQDYKSYNEGGENEDNSPLFDMANDNFNNPYNILISLVGKNNIKKLFTFDY